MVTEHDRANIDRIMAGHGDWFTAQLLRLCAKADAPNLAKIGTTWPDVHALYLDWFLERT